ncbi:NAD(P)H-hydrate dehydratase [Parvularcula dongshanensis]|uniref:Bifunctional NAD(P)H-hydrate repair enzyme n=1 Tax=Parvularcula dongshanensis TaxID=1173995 RepID=A0A840HZX2_9PROT|nr:NAD(P)H-hydrate dehydratase [Parvularcula dongshanensis]MBB4657581.1 NAD(P)H-hydrate epimerase [Parvularcula dongshanensis]
MSRLDARAVAGGTSQTSLIERAARSCVRVIRGRYTRRPAAVLCGPGNNGADGWAIARLLRAADWPVTVYTLTPQKDLTGAAGQVAKGSGLTAEPLRAFRPEAAGLVIDALFGAGLSRPLVGDARGALDSLAEAAVPVVAIDLPSGVDGATGSVLGTAARAEVTVTFHAPKPGHLLSPGLGLRGELVVTDIGLPQDAEPDAHWNGPCLWTLPVPERDTHKYARGAVLVFGGPRIAGGAARLSAHGAARIGAGAVTVASPEEALDIYAAHLDAIMVKPVTDAASAKRLIEASKAKALVIGPGAGRTDATRSHVLAALETRVPIVVDADALTVFEDDPDTLMQALHEKAVLTPHIGEFGRVFPDIQGDKLSMTAAAAARAGTTVLLKGADTVISTPSRVPVINTSGTPWLATAGAGDVLTGAIAGLMAQGLGAHDAACAGAYLHGLAGQRGGRGVTADDLPGLLREAGRAVATR